MEVKIKRLHPDAQLPKYAHPGDAGLDLYALEEYTLAPGERKLFKLGFAMEFPEGYVAFIKDRSGLAFKHGITTLAGVIEYTYRGEVGVVLLNTGNEPFPIHKGDRIAQMVFLPVATATVQEVEELSTTQRGEGGFGSTGIH